MSDLSEAIEAASEALAAEKNWRNWGTMTVSRRVARAMADAGYRIIKMPSRTPAVNDGSGGT